MLHGELHNSCGQGHLICSSRITISQVDLVETRGCNWHHIVSEEVAVVLWRNTTHIDSALEESVVERRVTSVDQLIVIVAQGQGTVQVEDDVAVGILEEVSLRLLQIDEAEGLQKVEKIC